MKIPIQEKIAELERRLVDAEAKIRKLESQRVDSFESRRVMRYKTTSGTVDAHWHAIWEHFDAIWKHVFGKAA